MSAVADANAEGLKAAGTRLKVARLYADYRELLTREKPDLVIGPAWITDRVRMVQAAAQAGCHIYCEKPFAATLADADAMAYVCRKAGVKLAMAHQFRHAARAQVLADLKAWQVRQGASP